MTSQLLRGYPTTLSSPFGPWGIAGLLLTATIVAVFFGLVAVTTSPILISMAVALLLGGALLVRPTWNIWLVLVLGLLVAGVVPIWADYFASKAVWGISILAFMLMGSAIFRVMSQSDIARGTPSFVWAALMFMIYAVFVSIIQFYSVGELLGGFKRYFQAFGLLLALSWLSIGEREIHRWRKFMVIVAILQLPFAVYELVSLVPMRERLPIPFLVPIDIVAGTFGANLYTGGANAEMATFLIIVLTFLLARMREKMISLGRFFLVAPVVLAPLFLGETKVVVILLPMMFVVLYRRELLARPHYALMGMVFGGVLTIGAGTAYLSVNKATLDEQLEETLSYNLYEKGHGSNLLNRTTVLTFWAERQGLDDPISFVLGNGLGASHTPMGGHIGVRYPSHGIGLTAASTLLWDLGIVGSALFLGILVLAWRSASRLRHSACEPWVRADAAAIQAVLPLLAFYLFYRLALLETLSFQIVFAMLLGYLAWMHRRHAGHANDA